MDDTTFYLKLNEFKKERILNNSIYKNSNYIKEFLEKKEVALEKKIIIAIENMQYDFITKIPNEQFKKLISTKMKEKELDDNKYKIDLNIYDEFLTSNSITSIQWEIILKDKEILPEEKIYFLKKGQMVIFNGNNISLKDCKIQADLIKNALPHKFEKTSQNRNL